jgi:putative spermidine/putrescine transport system permease protein
MALPSYVGPLGRAWHYGFLAICGLVFLYLIGPILIIIPLSFNAEPYFSFTEGMLTFESDAYSLRWYERILGGTRGTEWILAIENSFFIGVIATLLATTLGTLAALGLSRAHMPWRTPIMAVLISPMIVPLIITAAGMFFFYSKIGIAQTYLGIILAHTALGTPFVVITVTATLMGFDHTLTRASANLGAAPTRTFFKITVPLILPGVISGGLFAFITSFDEVVVMLFLAGPNQKTIPRQMWAGIREQISPTILSVATCLILFSILLMFALELLRRRNEKLRGIRQT